MEGVRRRTVGAPLIMTCHFAAVSAMTPVLQVRPETLGSMNLVDLGAVAAALLTPPIAFMSALWARRGSRQSADAALGAGVSQANASVTAARVQTRSELELRQQTALADASAAFLRAADALARTVQHLPGVEPEERHAQLAAHDMAVATALGPLELLAPPGLLHHSKALLKYCQTLEKLALDRAVLRSAVQALESGWCHLNPEACDHDHHSSAFVAWQFLVDWASLEDDERWRDRDLLEFCLQESQCMAEGETSRLLSVADRVPAAWSQMIGGFVRDPLMEQYASLRTPFIEAAGSVTPASIGAAVQSSISDFSP